MVVVLILAALIAMTIPSYLGARKRVQERAVQSNINNDFTAERTIFASLGQVSADTTNALPAEEPALHWIADATPSNAVKKTVVVSVGTITTPGDAVVLGAKADDGTCFYLRNAAGADVQYATEL